MKNFFDERRMKMEFLILNKDDNGPQYVVENDEPGGGKGCKNCSAYCDYTRCVNVAG